MRHANVIDTYKKKLTYLLQRTDDPILQNFIPQSISALEKQPHDYSYWNSYYFQGIGMVWYKFYNNADFDIIVEREGVNPESTKYQTITKRAIIKGRMKPNGLHVEYESREYHIREIMNYKDFAYARYALRDQKREVELLLQFFRVGVLTDL